MKLKHFYRNLKTNNKSFYYYMLRLRKDSRHTKDIKFLLGKLSRKYPDEDPRQFIEWLSKEVFEYEQYVKERKRKLDGID